MSGFERAGGCVDSFQEGHQGFALVFGEAHEPLRLELSDDRQHMCKSGFAGRREFQTTHAAVAGRNDLGEQPTFDESVQLEYQIPLVDAECLGQRDLVDFRIRRNDRQNGHLPSRKAAG